LLKPLEEPDQAVIPSDPVGASSSSSSSDKGKDKDDDSLVQRVAEAVQELLFSSRCHTPQPKRQSSRDRQYDAYKLSDQRFKISFQKFVPPEVFQKGNPSHIHDCVGYLREHPKLVKMLLKKTDILFDIKRTRNDRVFIAIQKLYTLTEEGDCFYQGNDSHLRYLGILDFTRTKYCRT
jgi:hypothetical protein